MRSNQVRLNCGVTMPLIGLGTYSFQNDRKTTELAVHMALKVQTVQLSLSFFSFLLFFFQNLLFLMIYSHNFFFEKDITSTSCVKGINHFNFICQKD